MDLEEQNLQKLEINSYNEIESLLNYSNWISINEPSNLDQKFNIIRTLINNIYTYLPESDKEGCEYAVISLQNELRKHKTRQKSNFISQADNIEREIRQFIRAKLAQKKIRGYYPQ